MNSDLALQRQQIPLKRRTKVHNIQRPRRPPRSPKLRRPSNRDQEQRRASIEKQTLASAVQSAAGVEILGQYAELESHLRVGWRVLRRGDDVD